MRKRSSQQGADPSLRLGDFTLRKMHYQTGVTTRQLLVESGLSRQLIAVARPSGHVIAMIGRFGVERGLTFAGEECLPGHSNGPQPRKLEPMGNVHEIYALRYATMSPPTPHLNYVPDPHQTAAQDRADGR